MTSEEFESLRFSYQLGITKENGASRLYRNEEHGLQKEIHTPKDVKTGEWGEGVVAFFIDGDDTVYNSSDELYTALKAKERIND
jgi:hypothetical protein